ncbi:CHAT domain-containing protein [Oscillochloris sp. ZM17-4]|uniref:CHAT domain-containing protein n=1 Tax=Oscillochloris sp. ZM17-4 TaxID=2866714 RepID=UPI001C735CAB|nr:CHAT domain-containing protein [Oscillochloris sp. ZM17-4]MBX0330280.1 CHAT domain-containing protein [Oscillochloris sp. ZM17-4]
MRSSASPAFQPLKDAIVAACSQGDYRPVQGLVQQAWALADASGHPADVAEAHWCAGLAHMHQESAAALAQFDAAYALYRDDPVLAARVQVNRGPLLARLGRVDEGATALAEAEETLRANGLLQRLPPLLLNRSELEARRGQYATMLAYAREAEQAALRCEAPDFAIMAQINQAFAAMFLGDLDLASAALDRARDLAVAEGYDDLVARVAVNQARLCTLQDRLIVALRLLQEARARFPPELAVEGATVAVEEALLYARLGMYEEGYRAARAAAQRFAAHQLAEESGEAALLALQMTLTAERSLPPWAFDQLRWLVRDRESLRAPARALADQVSPTLRAAMAALQAHPALQPTTDMAALLSQADAAATALTALNAPAAALNAGLIAAELAAALRASPAPRYRALAAQAAALGQPGLEQQAMEGLATVARGRAVSAALQRAADLAESMRRGLSSEELKARALTSQSLLHARLVEAYLRERQPDLALTALLAAKGGIWAEMGATRQVDRPDPAWQQARTALLFWEAQLRAAADDAERTVCQEQIRAALALLRSARPARPAAALPSLAAIQAQIPPGAVAVDYLLGERHALACVLTRADPPRWVTLGKTAAIRDAAERLGLRLHPLAQLPPAERRARAQAQRRATDTIFAELHDLLVAPLGTMPADAPLILAPDGALADLPWAAFYERGSPTPYLGQRHTLSLVPSLALLALERPPAASGPPLALGCADAAIAAQVEAELAAYARIFPTARVLPQASNADLAGARGAALLHISAHGRLNPQQPLLSAITLADGPLLLADVFNLDLTGTALAVLSACETSAVAPLGGLALALSGSFLAAGVTAVLAGLWQIDAEAARLFVESCYGALRDGASLTAAIQQAQATLRDSGYDHPYYWAALQPLMRAADVRIEPIPSTNPSRCAELT